MLRWVVVVPAAAAVWQWLSLAAGLHAARSETNSIVEPAAIALALALAVGSWVSRPSLLTRLFVVGACSISMAYALATRWPALGPEALDALAISLGLAGPLVVLLEQSLSRDRLRA